MLTILTREHATEQELENVFVAKHYDNIVLCNANYANNANMYI